MPLAADSRIRFFFADSRICLFAVCVICLWLRIRGFAFFFADSRICLFAVCVICLWLRIRGYAYAQLAYLRIYKSANLCFSIIQENQSFPNKSLVYTFSCTSANSSAFRFEMITSQFFLNISKSLITLEPKK